MLGSGTPDNMDVFSLQSILDIPDRDPDIYYINHSKFNALWWQKFPSRLLQVNEIFITSLKKYRLVIVDLSGEHWGDSSNQLTLLVQQQLESAGVKDFLIITHKIDDHKCTPNIVFCPSEYHTSREFIKTSQIDHILAEIQSPKSYPLSCLNNNAWPHRIYYLLQACRQPWFEKILYTINPADVGELRSDAIVLDRKMIWEWDQIKTHFAKRFRGGIWNLDNPAYQDSYANIVTETVVLPGVYLSEKTWKPVASGQWFVVLGCPGTINHLRTLGVDVFDDIFDHAHYDNEPDFFLRVHKLNQVIEDYMRKDHQRLWDATADRRKNNISRFRDGSFDTVYLSGVRDVLKKYVV